MRSGIPLCLCLLRIFQQALPPDPAELDAIESRLDEIYSLEQKHKVESVEELIELREKLRDRLDAL